jgi:hypothetical protein
LGRAQGRDARHPGPAELRRRLDGGRRGDPRRSGNSRSEVFAPLDRPWRRFGRREAKCRFARRPCWFVPTWHDPATDPVGTKRRQTTGSSWISTDLSPKSVGKCRHTLSRSAALMFCNIPSAASAASRTCGDEGSATEWCRVLKERHHGTEPKRVGTARRHRDEHAGSAAKLGTYGRDPLVQVGFAGHRSSRTQSSPLGSTGRIGEPDSMHSDDPGRPLLPEGAYGTAVPEAGERPSHQSITCDSVLAAAGCSRDWCRASTVARSTCRPPVAANPLQERQLFPCRTLHVLGHTG